MENKRIIDLNIVEFEDHIGQILDSKLNQALHELKEEEKLLTREQVIKRLGIAPSTLADYTHKGILTSYRIGHRVYYRWSEIINSAVKVEPQKRTK